MKQTIRVLISGGGTGGHIFPAISIANAIKARCPEADILFVGAENRMEMEKVPAAGYRIEGLPVSGFNRSNPLANFKVLWRLGKSLRLARQIVRRFNPDIAVGVGGYASGPTLWAAARRGVPTLIQEQNSYAGVTNKLLASKAHTVCVAYEGMERFFPAGKIVLTGNPVRQDLCNDRITRDEAFEFFGLDPHKKTILLIGGSLGALTLNTSVVESIPEIVKSGVQFIWQCGKRFGCRVYPRNREERRAVHLAVRQAVRREGPRRIEGGGRPGLHQTDALYRPHGPGLQGCRPGDFAGRSQLHLGALPAG